MPMKHYLELTARLQELGQDMSDHELPAMRKARKIEAILILVIDC